MANEAVLIIRTEHPIPFTVANSVGIEKGTLLKLSDPMTVAKVATDNDIVGGIAASEKIANDGKTKLGVYRGGIFKVTASGSITVGDPLSIEGDNLNTLKTTAGQSGSVFSGSKVWGIALETATVGETFLMELRPSCQVGIT